LPGASPGRRVRATARSWVLVGKGGADVDEVEEALRSLNQRTFDAEAHEPEDGWRDCLEEVLAEGFVLRRSKPELPNQTKREMIDRIAGPDYKATRRQLVPDSVTVWTSGALGVVASVVTLPDDSGGVLAFQNVKVFTSPSPGTWTCVYWQVSPMPAPA
jgi:hypothetical protein